ncbi:MAG: ribonuclease P protein component [Candidatus Komeilibacteria bacterium]
MKNSLNKEKDIFRVLRKKPFFSQHFVVKSAPGEDKQFRYTIIISKKQEKSAVKRNLIKRRIRSLVQKQKESIGPRTDFVISVKGKELAKVLRGEGLRLELLQVMDRAGIIKKEK